MRAGRPGRSRARLAACGLLVQACPAMAAPGLPLQQIAFAPPAETGLPDSAQLWLELVVNGRATGRVVPVSWRRGALWLDAGTLRDMHVPADGDGEIDLAAVPRLKAGYDAAGQRLLLEMPPEWLPAQAFAGAGRTRIPASASTGLLFNYDVHLARQSSGARPPATDAAVWMEARLFGDFGVIRSSAGLRQPLGGGRAHVARYDTGWSYVDEERLRTYEAGDLVTRTLPWASPVRLGGVQLSRDFAVRPDIVTYPLPRFAGTAALPSTLDLFVEGHQLLSTGVAPGPYTLSPEPYVSGAGEAVLVTTDAVGRSVTASFPFYVANNLLRPGLSDYAVSAGLVRTGYGAGADGYGPFAASAALRHGLTDWLTAEGQLQGKSGLLFAGVGAVARLGRAGVVDVSLAASRHQGRAGQRFGIGYQYQGRRINFAASHQGWSRDFADLGQVLSLGGSGGGHTSRANLSVTPAIGGLSQGGTLGIGFTDMRRADSRFRLLQMGYTRPIGRSASLIWSASRDFVHGGFTAMLALSASFGGGRTAQLGLERNARGDWAQRLSAGRSIPSDGGLGVRADLLRARGGELRYQGEVSWRAAPLLLRAGAAGSRGQGRQWLDASGSVALMDGRLLFANRVGDAFLLISTEGVPGIRVRQDNQTVGTTGPGGHLLLPWVSAFAATRVEIETLDLPPDVATPLVEQTVAVRAGSGRVLAFPVRQAAAAMVELVDGAGAHLPPGTPVTTDGGATAQLGWDGLVWLEGLAPRTRLTAKLADGRACSAAFALTPVPGELSRIGPLPCR